MSKSGSIEERLQRGKRVAALLLIVVVVAGSAILWQNGTLRHLWDKDQLVHALRHDGVKGPLFCVAAQSIQVVIFVLPGEITQLAAGYVFGVWRGLLYSVIGILLGSAFNFYLARVLGRPALRAIISARTLDKIDRMFAKARTKSAIFLLFLLPGAPKDVLCYGAGFSHMSLLEFMVISGLGRLPALFASVLIGSRAYHRDLMSIAIIGLLLILAIVAYYFYERQRGNGKTVKASSGQP